MIETLRPYRKEVDQYVGWLDITNCNNNTFKIDQYPAHGAALIRTIGRELKTPS